MIIEFSTLSQFCMILGWCNRKKGDVWGLPILCFSMYDNLNMNGGCKKIRREVAWP